MPLFEVGDLSFHICIYIYICNYTCISIYAHICKFKLKGTSFLPSEKDP